MSTRYVVCATCSVMLLLAGRGESVMDLVAAQSYGQVGITEDWRRCSSPAMTPASPRRRSLPSPASRFPARITTSSNYGDLAGLFDEFRGFQESTNNNNGVPDYSAAAIREQYRGLKQFQERLAAMETGDWPVWQRVDYHLVRAEMNALEFPSPGAQALGT